MNYLAKLIFAMQNNQNPLEVGSMDRIAQEAVDGLWNLLPISPEEVANFFDEQPVDVEWYGSFREII